MKINKLLTLLVVFGVLSFTSIAQESYRTIVEESTVAWKGYKSNGTHNGVINILKGSLGAEGGVLKGGAFTIDMHTIKVLDSKSRKLLKHLKSEDFFDVEKYPTATFVILGSEIKNEMTLVKGEITIKGITKDLEFLANIFINEKEELVLESETFQINRTEFNIKYKSKAFFENLKDKFISDKFDLKVKIVSRK